MNPALQTLVRSGTGVGFDHLVAEVAVAIVALTGVVLAVLWCVALAVVQVVVVLPAFKKLLDLQLR